MTRLQLFLLGVALTATAGLVLVRALSGGKQARMLSGRLADVARSLAPARVAQEGARRRRSVLVLPANLPNAAAATFGYRLERLDQYPLPPLAIVLAALLPATVAGLYAASFFGGWARLLVLPLWLLFARIAFGKIHARRAAKLYLQLPDTLSMIVRAVRAGIPVVEALRTVGREVMDPTGAEFRRMSDQLSIGITLETALRGLALRSGLSEYGFFAVALTLQNSAGGNLTDTLDNLADVVRKRVAARQRGAAMASQARTSAYILASVPVVTIAALLLINPDYIMLLFEDPRGNTLIALALASLGCGLGSMRLMITRSLS